MTTEPGPAARPCRADAEAAARLLLLYLGEDLKRAGLEDTPARLVRGLEDLTWGLRAEPPELTQFAVPEADPEQPIVVRGIDFSSLCEHHMLPFWGQADLVYLPLGGQVLGLSKLVRLVAFWAARPQVQERLTHQIAVHLGKAAAAPARIDESNLRAMRERGLDVLVRLRAQHACMRCRGVCSAAETVTVAALGRLRTDPLRTQVDRAIGENR